jgi:conjugal transfer ATP-binding protein TraC
MGRAMEAAFRQARKHDGAVVVVTQGIADLYGSPAAKAMIDNAAWQLILAQKAEAVDNVFNSGKLVIDAYSHQMLKTVQTIPGSHSEIMVMGNGGCGIFRLIVDRFTQAMYSTTGRERNQVLNDIENGVDVIESLQRLIVGEDSFDRVKKIEMLIEEAMRLGRSKEEVSRMVQNAAQNVESQLKQERAQV